MVLPSHSRQLMLLLLLLAIDLERKIALTEAVAKRSSFCALHIILLLLYSLLGNLINKEPTALSLEMRRANWVDSSRWPWIVFTAENIFPLTNRAVLSKFRVDSMLK